MRGDRAVWLDVEMSVHPVAYGLLGSQPWHVVLSQALQEVTRSESAERVHVRARVHLDELTFVSSE